MALVEAVAGELVDQLEDVGRVVLLDAVLHGAGDEARLLLGHAGLVFFAHGAAQVVGLPEREAAHHLGDLDDLLLVDDDAVGLRAGCGSSSGCRQSIGSSPCLRLM